MQINTNTMHKIVIAVTGASGSIYAKRLIDKLLTAKEQWHDLAVVMTENAKEVWKTEIGDESYSDIPLKFYSTTDFSAPFASGSGQFGAMIVVPCSMGTLGRMATGISNDLNESSRRCFKGKKKINMCGA